LLVFRNYITMHGFMNVKFTFRFVILSNFAVGILTQFPPVISDFTNLRTA